MFGSLPFVIHDVQYIKGLLNFLNRNGVAIPFFATGENHNTPRVCHTLAGREAGRRRALFLFTLGAVLPAMPFIHSGMEICEWHPVNLGLNFTDDDRQRFPPKHCRSSRPPPAIGRTPTDSNRSATTSAKYSTSEAATST